MMRLVAVRKFFDVFFVVTNIWFGVDGNNGATIKNNISVCPRLVKNPNPRNRVGAVCSVII